MYRYPMRSGWVGQDMETKLRPAPIEEAVQLLADPAVAEGGLHYQE